MIARDELANNLAKLSATDDWRSEVKKHLARECQQLTETDDTEIQEEIPSRIRKLQGELSNIELERQANRAALRSQINRIHETIRRLLHEDKTLAEHIHTLS